MNEHATSGESAVDAGVVTVRGDSASSARPVGWVGAAAIGVGVSLALALLLLWCPNWLLTRLPMLSRGLRVALATGWIGCVTVALIWFAARVAAAPAVDA